MTRAPAHAAAAAPLPARTGRTRPGPATRQTSLILGPLPTAPGTARATLHTALILWGLAHLSDDAEAITTELVTNAITASTSKAPPGTEPRPVTIWITARDQELCIRVWDPDPAPPPLHQLPPGPLTEHGRGLLIVTALSHQWGWHPAPNGGKYLWATLRAQPPRLNHPPRSQKTPGPAMQPNPGTTPRPAQCPPAWADEQLASLRTRVQGWHAWHVRNYPAGDYTWCAMPAGALTAELQAHSPDALTERITEYEATLDHHIADTRKELASLPPGRPETPGRRNVLNARLEALLRLQARRVPA